MRELRNEQTLSNKREDHFEENKLNKENNLKTKR